MNTSHNIRIMIVLLIAGGANGLCQTLKEKPMFTLEQIKNAHAKVKSGADFPAYAKELKELGLSHYEFYLSDGHAEYFGQNGQKLVSEPKWEKREIGMKNTELMQNAIRVHQQGGSDFPTVAIEAARYGVGKWIVDFLAMTCTYYASDGSVMFVETIP